VVGSIKPRSQQEEQTMAVQPKRPVNYLAGPLTILTDLGSNAVRDVAALLNELLAEAFAAPSQDVASSAPATRSLPSDGPGAAARFPEARLEHARQILAAAVTS
jgi:hypothetical protein